MANATTQLVEDLTIFNKDYSGDLKVKSETDTKIFEKVEKSRFNFQETLSTATLSSQSSILQDSISSMI